MKKNRNYSRALKNIVYNNISLGSFSSREISKAASIVSNILVNKTPNRTLINILKEPIWRRVNVAYFNGEIFSKSEYECVLASAAYLMAIDAISGKVKLEKAMIKHGDGAIILQYINIKRSFGEPIAWSKLLQKKDSRVLMRAIKQNSYKDIRKAFGLYKKGNLPMQVYNEFINELSIKAYTHKHDKKTIDGILKGCQFSLQTGNPKPIQIIGSIPKKNYVSFLFKLYENIKSYPKNISVELFPENLYSPLICYMLKEIDKHYLPSFINYSKYYCEVKEVLNNRMGGKWS
mgnify:CR=1 FL=1